MIDALREFLKVHPPAEGKRHAIIWDNAPWHKKAYRLIEQEDSPEYDDIREKAFLVMLPPYSPDLNPIEQVWRIVRRKYTHNRFFRSPAALKEQLDVPFTKWAEPNEELKSLCQFGAGERAQKRHARLASK